MKPVQQFNRICDQFNVPGQREAWVKRSDALVEKIMATFGGEAGFTDNVRDKLLQHVPELTNEGKFDPEMFADACDEMQRVFTSEKVKNELVWVMDEFSKHTRMNLLTWVEQWRNFFKCLAFFEDELQAYYDYTNAQAFGAQTPAEFEALEQKYAPQTELQQAA